MFKKRGFKTGRAPAATKAKRPLHAEESLSESDDASDAASTSSSQDIKKRKVLTTAKKPTRDVIHGLDLGTESKLSDPSKERATGSSTSTSGSGGTSDGAKGPIKPPPASIKTTTITDFQPDVCKDFLQTGYCGYGDTCKFLHIRDELRQRQPVEKDWETVAQSNPKKTTSLVPYRCVICKNDYTLPVKTQCSHMFCQKCFMHRYKTQKKPNCYICGKDTGGVCSPVLKKELEALLS